MSTFERIPSGFPGLDAMLDYIRLGDNVVLQVSSIEEYMFFVKPYCRQAMPGWPQSDLYAFYRTFSAAG